MIVFENLVLAIKRLDKGMQQAVKNAVQQPYIEAQMIDANVAQMNAGQYNDGQMIEPPYAELTVAIKKVKGQPFNIVTLEDEGDFHHHTIIEYRSTDMFFTSTDWKTDDLTKKYGWQIFGLNDINLTYVRVECLPFLLNYARTQIQLR